MDEALAVDFLDHDIVDTGGRDTIHRRFDGHPFRHLVVTGEETGDHQCRGHQALPRREIPLCRG